MTMQSEVTGSGPLRTVLMSTGALLLVIAVVVSPKDAFDASIQGLDIWWKIIFPAMLPFLMLSQMLTAFGFTHALGVLLGPLMQRWFRLPGKAGLAIVVGMCGGFPAGADTASRLVQDQQITAKQAGIVASASHFANPLMIILVIGAAFLHQPAAGYFLLIVHWVSGWIAAMIGVRLLPKESKEEEFPTANPSSYKRRSLWSQMMLAAREAQKRDGRGFGKLLGDTVSQAVQTLMMTGGYMIVFAVFVRLLTLYITPGTSVAFWPSLLELHLGTYHLSQSPLTPVLLMSLLAAVLGWGGLCSHLQVSAVLKAAGLATTSMLYFAGIRLLHALVAFLISLLLWLPFSRYSSEVWATFQNNPGNGLTPFLTKQSLVGMNTSDIIDAVWIGFPAACIGLALLLTIMICLSGLTFWFNRRFSR
ncbi:MULTISPECIES: nucleoside recognition domain-containing protein [unclassified Paenibacillus]|uniref:nucleoside recognition domain-containing protein n=1 Tax=unclassified Paenibacillus TaxID=185978 RepID=UPI0009A6D60C|nr:MULTISPECIES: nucleoside recognition domain-containing protein [unclassified Paenibacillus]SLJ97975.1 sporulation integral membrane protein YlbJ [Paenibacillus sp. RU5A]SOC66839.1 sporulation integral membrane protein YlbJ [Paenibacillus sp. RU26A]SOC70012.1 sporulation integral membrane protein YlbJ [Paenibacillus sp. RU5M]